MFNKKDEISIKYRSSSPFKSFFHIHKKGRNARQKLRKARRAYVKERTKQRERLKREMANVDILFEKGTINEDIYTRYKKMLEIGYAEKRQETREKYGFLNSDANITA